MSCCGNKRQEWLRQSDIPVHKPDLEKDPPVISEKPARIFEYTGNDSLLVHGPGSGKMYHFKFRGDKLEVDYIDSFALMAMRDLRVLKV